MDLPARPMRTLSNQEESRTRDGQIRQEGSQYGPTQVSGGIALQGNFVGVTISERPLPHTMLSVILTTSRLHSTARLRWQVLPLLARAGESVRSETIPTRPDQDTAV
jgi:hypothetical protein